MSSIVGKLYILSLPYMVNLHDLKVLPIILSSKQVSITYPCIMDHMKGFKFNRHYIHASPA